MSRRGLIALLGLTLVIIAVVVVDLQLEKKKEKKEETEKKILKIDWDAVRYIEIERSDKGVKIRLERKKEGDKVRWYLIEPVNEEADHDAVERLWTALNDLTAEDSFNLETGMDLSPFQLDKPRATIRLLDAAKKTVGVLHIGGKAQVSGDLYSTVPGSGKIFLIAGYRESTLLPEPKDLRNRKLTDIKSVDIARLDMERRLKEPGRLVMEHVNGLWVIRQPRPYLADSGKLFSLTSSIEFLEARDFIEEEASELDKYGLALPRVRLTVTTKKGSTITLLVGDPKGEDEVYAMVEGRPRVVTVNKSFLDDLEKELTYWQAPSAVDFDYYNLEQAEIIRGKNIYKLQRVTEEGEEFKEQWFIVRDGKRNELTFETVDEFFRNIDYGEGLLETDNFNDDLRSDYPVDQPWLKIRLKDKEKKWQTLVIFEKEGAGYEWNPDFPHVIYRINEDDWKDIKNAWEPLKKLLSG